MLKHLTEIALSGEGCSPEEARWLLTQPEAELFAAATRIRTARFGNRIQLCSIINAKNGHCDMDCRFCSQSSHSSTRIDPYPLLDIQTLETKIGALIDGGTRRCGVVTSGGKLSNQEIGVLAEAARNLSQEHPAPLCASLGRLNSAEFEVLREAGITRYHHNLETSEAFYPKVCTTQSWRKRADTVRMAQEAGMEVCCGGLFGLGESWNDRIDLAITLRDLRIVHVPINFLCPHEGTPFGNHSLLDASEALRIIAVYRFILPLATLRVCGGRPQVLGDRAAEIFAAGANGLMTGDYLTVAGSLYETDLEMIRRLGLQIDPA